MVSLDRQKDALHPAMASSASSSRGSKKQSNFVAEFTRRFSTNMRQKPYFYLIISTGKSHGDVERRATPF